jgi:hypothetical protein
MGFAEKGMRPTVDGATVVERVAEHVRSHIPRQRLPRGAPLPSKRPEKKETLKHA